VFARRIAVIGTGYVGLTTGACLASLGHAVVCADVDVAKVERLRRGEVDILEPDLAEVVHSGLSAGRLAFVVGTAAALHRDGLHAEVVFLCLPTPMGAGGSADLSVVAQVVEEIREELAPGTVVVTKSTVPVGTARTLGELIGRDDVAVVSNPEFLREGAAVGDFLDPDRIVVGSDAQDAAERVAALYSRVGAPTVLTDAASAELVKYAANCFLAMKLSYVNALAELCERLGADIDAVTEGLGHDRRIGQAFLRPGPGWGGSCLPKDTEAMLRLADAADFEFRLVRAAIETNERQTRRIVEKVRRAVTGSRSGSLHRTRLGLLGLTFKAGTNDLRDSPALAVAAQLRQAGATVVAHDPVIAPETALPGAVLPPEAVVGSAELAVKDVDAVVLLTEWPEFRTLDWGALAGIVRRPVVVDTRNLLDPDVLARAGFERHGIGRRPRASTHAAPA
jgi:UDPglucose 6-dehydrogenase